jgi:palmitoyltransferase
MTVTSIDLAMDNYTQVEKLGAKSVVHILAVLKPPQAEIGRVRNDPGPQSFHKEITYPLGAGLPPNPDYYQPAGIPRTKAYLHVRQSEPTTSPPKIVPAVEEVGGRSPAPVQRSTGAVANAESTSEPDEKSSAIQRIPEARKQIHPTTARNGMLVKESEISADPAAQKEVRQNASRRERLSKRDLQATRTFAILPMLKAGDNPWDLGSRISNFKTVMGTKVLDWFLPIRRSPCCNHEDTESQFQVGPMVDLLKSSVGFIPPREPSTLLRQRRRKRRRHGSEKRAATDGVDGQPHDLTRPENHISSDDGNDPSSQPGLSIPMQDFVDASPVSRLG